MVDGGDAVLDGFGGRRQEAPQNGVIGHIHEGNHGVPALVIIPHLTEGGGVNTNYKKRLYKPVKSTHTFMLNSLSMYRKKVPKSLRARPE